MFPHFQRLLLISNGQNGSIYHHYYSTLPYWPFNSVLLSSWHFNSAHFVNRTMWNTNDDRYSEFGYFYEKKVFENVEASMHSQGFVRRIVLNTKYDRYSDFVHLIRKTKFATMWKRLYIDRALSVGQCGILTMIDTPNSAIFMRTIFRFWPFLCFHISRFWTVFFFFFFFFFLELCQNRDVSTFLDFDYFLFILFFFRKCRNVCIRDIA